MSLQIVDIQNIVVDKFGDKVSNFRVEDDIFTFEVSSEVIKDLIRFMKENEELHFNFLTDLCGMHYPHNVEQSQFAVVYLLHNWVDKVRIRIKTFISYQSAQLDTVSDIFAGANWMERETYDFFGIKFNGHPNLKRVLNDEAMVSFPMRKDYPLEDSSRSDKDDRFFGRTTNNYQKK